LHLHRYTRSIHLRREKTIFSLPARGEGWGRGFLFSVPFPTCSYVRGSVIKNSNYQPSSLTPCFSMVRLRNSLYKAGCRPHITSFCDLWVIFAGTTHSNFPSNQLFNSAALIRTWSVLSRFLIVTALSSIESKSTVTQYGVPISSWRRYRLPIEPV